MVLLTAPTARAQDVSARVTVVRTPSAPRCGEGGIVAVAFDVRLEEMVAGVGSAGDILRVATLCPRTPSASEIRRSRRPRGFVGIWPRDSVCLQFEPMSHLPPYDILVADPGEAPTHGVSRRPDGECV